MSPTAMLIQAGRLSRRLGGLVDLGRVRLDRAELGVDLVHRLGVRAAGLGTLHGDRGGQGFLAAAAGVEHDVVHGVRPVAVEQLGAGDELAGKHPARDADDLEARAVGGRAADRLAVEEEDHRVGELRIEPLSRADIHQRALGHQGEVPQRPVHRLVDPRRGQGGGFGGVGIPECHGGTCSPRVRACATCRSSNDGSENAGRALHRSLSRSPPSVRR